LGTRGFINGFGNDHEGLNQLLAMLLLPFDHPHQRTILEDEVVH
jgi:hypothetical protein